MKTAPTPESTYYQQQSERLSFRLLTADDWQTWQPFFPDNPNLRFVGQDDDRSPEEKAQTWINRQLERKQNGEFGQLAVCLKETDEFIGVGGLIYRVLEDGPVLEVTYSLMPAHHGKGFATELALHFLNYSFHHLNQDRMISLIHTENIASMRVAEKNGLYRKKEFEFLGFQVYVYEILRSEFVKD